MGNHGSGVAGRPNDDVWAEAMAYARLRGELARRLLAGELDGRGWWLRTRALAASTSREARAMAARALAVRSEAAGRRPR